MAEMATPPSLLFQRLRSSSFVRDTATLTVGTIIAQLVNLAALPVLSRLYSPVAFGQLGVFIAVVTIAATALTLRYELMIMLPEKERASDRVALLSVVISLLFGGLLAFIAWGIPPLPLAVLGLGAIDKWLPLAALTGIACSFAAIGGYWLNRRRRYSTMAAQRVGQVAVAAVVGISCGALGNPSGLIFAQAAGFFSVAFACLWHMRVIFTLRGSALGHVARENASAPAYLLPSALLDVASMQLPVMLITMWFGTFDAGQFSMAWRILWLPIATVGAAVGQVFFQRFAQLQNDPEAARTLLFRTWKSLFLFGALPTAAVMAFGPWLFSALLGGAWREAGSLATVLSPMLLALLIVGPTSSAMITLGLNKQMMIFGLVSFLYRPLCLWIGYEFGSLRLGIFLYVMSEVVQVITYMGFILNGLRRS